MRRGVCRWAGRRRSFDAGGGGAVWVSDDGLTFRPEWTQRGFDRIPAYFPEFDPHRVARVYGGDPKFERPKVLTINGSPAYLYATSGCNVTGGPRTVSHVLKVDLQPGDGPLMQLARGGAFRGADEAIRGAALDAIRGVKDWMDGRMINSAATDAPLEFWWRLFNYPARD
jgi:hypothetical protein